MIAGFSLGLLGCFLIVALGARAQEARTGLVVDDFSTWRGDTGDWQVVADTSSDPADEKLLASKSGTGVVVNGPTGRTKHLVSKAEHGDVRAHIEFMVPKGSNSGVYFQGRYEVQVLDSWGVEHPKYSDCGGIYQRYDDLREPKGYQGHAPRINASLPPGEWQTFDVVFRAPKFNAAGRKVANAQFVEVTLNGKRIHKNVTLYGPTRASLFDDEKPVGPVMLQGDHGPVAYRNVWFEPVDLANPFFAMDTGTRDERHSDAASQAAMLDALGFDGIGFSGFAQVPEMLAELDPLGLEMFTVYINTDLETELQAHDMANKERIRAIEGRNAIAWLTISSKTYALSSENGDAQAVNLIREMADVAAEVGMRIALYPHTGCWLETVEDAVRLVKKVDRPNVGATFNLCHWLKVSKGQDLRETLEAATPYLFVVTINGADPGDNWDKLIQTLDQGSVDVGEVLAILDELGYEGPIGLQGYGIKGDVHENLKRSMSAWRKMTAR